MIYFITHDEKYVKIGIAKDPRERLSQLQIGNPIRLKLWFAVDGNEFTEKGLHVTWNEWRIMGEWFEFSQPIRDFMKGWVYYRGGNFDQYCKELNGICGCPDGVPIKNAVDAIEEEYIG